MIYPLSLSSIVERCPWSSQSTVAAGRPLSIISWSISLTPYITLHCIALHCITLHYQPCKFYHGEIWMYGSECTATKMPTNCYRSCKVLPFYILFCYHDMTLILKISKHLHWRGCNEIPKLWIWAPPSVTYIIGVGWKWYQLVVRSRLSMLQTILAIWRLAT